MAAGERTATGSPRTVLVNADSGARPLAAVVLASAGRPALLAAVMSDVDRQTAGPLLKVLSVPDESSMPRGADSRPGWIVVTGARGLAAQRNAALDALPGQPVVFFFDDDAVLREDYVANALQFLEAHPDVVGLTGRVLLDGAVRGEVSIAAAYRAIEQSAREPSTGAWERRRELYGCNFAVRTAAAPDLRFDQRLPLYSWLEDHDFARRLMPSGVLARVDACVIVHRAAASGGRESHVRLGYSQVMNPVYLWSKGSFPLWLMLSEAGKRVAKNILMSLGAQGSWRRRRVRGNALALVDVLRRRITPERITSL